MAEAILQRVIDNLASMIGREIGFLSGIDREAEKLSSTLSTILAVLEDAETKQLAEKTVKNWLLKLRDAAYAVDDILDECQTEAIVLESQQCRSRIVTKVRTSLYHLNNVLRRRSIGSRMTAIRMKLDEIAEERSKFHLREMSAVGRMKAMDRPQRSSNPSSSTEVYGREEDKKKIVETITNDFRNREKVSVYVVVGMGGIGKTTLAQTVYSDQRVLNHFEPRIWISAPEDFDTRRVLKAIVESASGNAMEDLDLDMLARRLQDLLTGKRYLLVLDDVWSEDQDKWEELKSVLECGSAGSSLIITTRLVKVAMVAGTVRAHTLSPLLDEECWLLFRNRAFGEESEERPNIVSIGKEIVRKCGGIPLAAKALGSLMRFKVDENEWLAIRDSEIWHLPAGETSILPALRVSFINLPLPLRACFALDGEWVYIIRRNARTRRCGKQNMQRAMLEVVLPRGDTRSIWKHNELQNA